MLTNILSGASWLVSLLSGLLVIFIGASGEGGRDGGRALATMMLSPVFAGSMLLAFGFALRRGGMDWVAPQSGALRWWIVLLAVLASAVTVCFCAAVRLEPVSQAPWALWPLRGWAHWVWPPVLVAGAARALWPGLREGWPTLAWRAPLGLVGGVSLLVCVGLLVNLVQSSVADGAVRAQAEQDYHDRRDRMMMDKVEQADPVRDFASLMSQTSQWEKPEIRAKALAKVRAHPDLTGALAELLRCDLRDEAYTFLASNDAPDPQALLAPLRDAFAATPPDLQRRLADNRSLRADEYMHEVQRVLAVADKFEPQGLDPMPLALALRAALSAPRASDIRLDGSVLLDQWLAQRERAGKR